MTGRIAQALESDVRTQVRRHGIVPWLDHRGDYTAFVDHLTTQADLDFQVVAFRGSHLQLMLALEQVGAGVDPPRLLLHLPGFNEERVKASPAYGLYAAGARYRKALDTLIKEAATGHATVEQIEEFLEGDALDLAGADAWLDAVVSRRADAGGLAVRLDGMTLPAVIDDLLSKKGPIRRSLPAEADALWAWLDVQTGCPADWPARQGATSRADVLFAVVSWVLCVEFVKDLAREPVMTRLHAVNRLPVGLVEACRGLAEHLRAHHRVTYERIADETVRHIEPERRAAKAEDLGRIDTFRFEEAVVARAALAQLKAQHWDEAAEHAAARLDGGSFWLQDDPERSAVWQLIAAAAKLGQTIEAATHSLKAAHLSTAVERYVARGAAVDRAHRRLESVRDRLLFPTLPAFERLRGALDGMRRHWRAWADDWADQFNALCQREGFLPEPALQQRTLFDDVVLPATRDGATALFLIDALRYEMAEALVGTFEQGGTRVQLDARLAELPTITAVGMNALAPVARQGVLTPKLRNDKIEGFHSGEFTVNTQANRKRAMAARAGGKTCPWWSLEDVIEREPGSLRTAVKQARLVVVHSLEIDGPAEKGAGLNVFEPVLQRIRAAWHRLRDAGVRRFVITADHGFLLVDSSARQHALTHGRASDPRRRYAFNTHPIDQDGEARVPLSDLRYADAEGHLIFPRTTALFDVGAHEMRFVHGGNSLQERVIPVLTVAHASAPGAATMTYRISAQAAEGMGGMHALSAILEPDMPGLFGIDAADLTLQVDDPAVQIELCHARGARLDGATFRARLDQRFEIFFRLTGSHDARVQVKVANAGSPIELIPGVVAERFAVADALETSITEKPTTDATEPAPAPDPGPEPTATDWLDAIPAQFRPVFDHLARHGSVTEAEATGLLGTPRRFRKFHRAFEQTARLAPFEVRVDSAAGLKTYIRLKRTRR